MSNNRQAVHHEANFSQHLATAIPPIPHAMRASIYPVPAITPAGHRSSAMVPPSQQLMLPSHGPSMHRVHNNNLIMGSTRQPGLPRSHASIGHAPFAASNHILSYGMATGGSTSDLPSNHYIPSHRQPMVSALN